MPAPKDLVGQKFNKLTVIERVEDAVSPKGYHTKQYLCRCDCGNKTIVRADKLVAGTVKSCGCFRKENTAQLKKVDITGQRFGKLIAIKRIEGSNWLCRCDCGNECVRKTGALTSGNSTGCGKCRAKDFTNMICGDYKVLHRVSGKNTDVYWQCKCEKCGHEQVFTSTRLKSNPNCVECRIMGPSHYEDLTGQRFGRLTVIARAEDKVYKSGKHKIQWLCRCDCGKEVTATANILKRGEKQSCGCLRRETTAVTARKAAKIRHQSSVDKSVGSRYGRWVVQSVLQPGKTDEDTIVHCRCDCGTERDMVLRHLKVGDSKSCGCLQRERAGEYAFQDLTGKRFGYWTVLYQNGHNRSGGITWRCRCERCGEEYDVDGGNLRSGQSAMCAACSSKVNGEKLRANLIGQRFGMLSVMDFAFVKNNNTYWHCKCDCGNEVDVSVGGLTSGNTRSCGCWHRSHAEDITENILSKYSYEYQSQVKFKGLTGIGRAMLSYDFGLYENGELYALVECQGQQHYRPVDLFGGDEQYEIQCLHDELKQEFCEENHILLITIPYDFTEEEIEEMFQR